MGCIAIELSTTKTNANNYVINSDRLEVKLKPSQCYTSSDSSTEHREVWKPEGPDAAESEHSEDSSEAVGGILVPKDFTS